MSESDEEYGPPLPPGLSKQSSNVDSDDERSHASSSSKPIGPALPAHLGNLSTYTSDSEADSDDSVDHDEKKTPKVYNKTNSKHQTAASVSTIGPALPPHLQQHNKRKSQDIEEEDNVSGGIGPSLPPHLQHLARPGTDEAVQDGTDSDDDDDGIGPSVALKSSGAEGSAAREFEIRAQKMRERLEGKDEEEDTGPKKRESWMTELPSALGVGGVLENRQFRKNAAPEQDTSWTETPQDRERREREGGSNSKKRKKDANYGPTEEDLRAAADIEAYNKKNRPKSLMEMHQKELKKKKKKEKKKNKNKEKERRPFDRDADLQVNRLDDAKRKAIIKRSQELSSRFKTGGTGTSFL